MEDQQLFYYLAGVPLLGFIAQWLAWRLRVPSILLLLLFGGILGAFVNVDRMIGDLAGSGPEVASQFLFPIVSLSVAIILFEGGLTLRLSELKDAGRGVFRLVSLGALVSWVLAAAAAAWVLELSPRLAALLGAVLVVTGPTVVAPLLRTIRPSRKVGAIVKWEGIVIDPIGAILAVLVFETVIAHHADASVVSAIWILAKTVLIGGGIGLAAAMLLMRTVKHFLIPDFLHGVAFLTVALGCFAFSNALQHESGLVTVTILGIALANQKAISVHHIVEFKEHLGVLLISCLFIVLGSRLELQSLVDLGLPGLLFLALMILIVRPASVFLSTIGSGLRWQERTFLACLAPRGIVAAAVSSVFALKIEAASHELGDPQLAAQAEQLVPITFMIIVGTVLVYGLSAAPLARWLALAEPNPQGILFAGAEAWIRRLAKVLQEADVQVLLVDTNYGNVAAAQMDGIPAHCASVLSEHVREEMDLGGIGRMLAMTANDEVNTLAVGEFAHLFGRKNVYQLSPWDRRAGKRTSVSEHLRGRVLFHEDLHHDALESLLAQEMTLKRTQLTETFTLADFQNQYGEHYYLLFLVDREGQLSIATTEQPLAPEAGDTVVALVQKPPLAEVQAISEPDPSAKD